MEKKSFVRRYPSFVIFAVLAVLLILVAVFAPQLSRGVNPIKGSLKESIMPPSPEHPFGTDKMGRDIFVRVLYGARTSLSSTFILVAVVFVIGSFLGILAGYFGGWVDHVLMRIAEAHGRTVAQIALRFLYQRGIPIIPKSTHIERMKENLTISDFSLTDEEMATIGNLDMGKSLFGWW